MLIPHLTKVYIIYWDVYLFCGLCPVVGNVVIDRDSPEVFGLYTNSADDLHGLKWPHNVGAIER